VPGPERAAAAPAPPDEPREGLARHLSLPPQHDQPLHRHCHQLDAQRDTTTPGVAATPGGAGVWCASAGGLSRDPKTGETRSTPEGHPDARPRYWRRRLMGSALGASTRRGLLEVQHREQLVGLLVKPGLAHSLTTGCTPPMHKNLVVSCISSRHT
jgi:hypothetical protein